MQLMAVGDLEPYWNPRTKRQEWRWVPPEVCGNGHPLGLNQAHLTWRGCNCAPGVRGHTVVICRTCNDEQLFPVCLA